MHVKKSTQTPELRCKCKTGKRGNRTRGGEEGEGGRIGAREGEGEGEGKREGMVSKYNIPKWKVEGAMGMEMEMGRG